MSRPGFDLAAGRNLNDYWDLNLLTISAHIGMIRGGPTLLVTNEKQLIALVGSAGRADIINLTSSCEQVGLPNGA